MIEFANMENTAHRGEEETKVRKERAKGGGEQEARIHVV
jgi:hypothetical protein